MDMATKDIKWIWIGFSILVSLSFLLGPAFAQEIAYTYKIIDQPGAAQDLNVHGDVVLTNYPYPGGTILTKKNRRMNATHFQCWDTIFDATQIKKIDNQGNVVGNCQIDGTQHGRQVGFIRDKRGVVAFLDVPGADITEGYAVSDERACGQFYTPSIPNASGFARVHGFCKSTNGAYQTLDVPMPFTVTVITGLNSRKKVGNFFVYDSVTNETSQWGAFIEDNGTFTALSVPGATFTYVLDINGHDDVLLDSSKGNYILSDGIYFKIGNPPADPGFTVTDLQVNGFNDELELAGTYLQRQTGCGGEFIINCPMIFRSFVATPALPQVAAR